MVEERISVTAYSVYPEKKIPKVEVVEILTAWIEEKPAYDAYAVLSFVAQGKIPSHELVELIKKSTSRVMKRHGSILGLPSRKKGVIRQRASRKGAGV